MEIKAPDLGVESAEVAEILVKVGDVISENDNIVLVESDKASVEIPSPVSGKVAAIAINVGDSVSEGSVLLTVEAADAADNTPAEPAAQEQPVQEMAAQAAPQAEEAQLAQAPQAAAGGSQTYNLPDLGVDSAEVAEIMMAVGDTVEENQPLLLVESDKASVEVPAPVSGVIESILVNVGDSVSNGQAFVVIKSAGATTAAASEPTPMQEPPKAEAPKAESKPVSAPSAAPAPTAKLSESEVNQKARDAHAGPAVRKLARELGVDISAVTGTAAHGRILKEDLFGYVKSVMTGAKAAPTASSTPAQSGGISLPPLPDMSNKEIWGEIETVDLTRLQKVSIPQLNLNTLLPQVTQFDLADITDTENLRNELKAEFKAQGVSLTILAFIVKAVAYALTQHPKFNSHVSDDNTQMIIRKSVHMGIAVATDDGLIVPVIRDAQDKGIKQLAIEIGELAKKARDKKLTAKELQGASFTISSQGNMGGTYFTPLVNHPQVAILGISESTFQPRWNGKEFEPRLMLPLSLSYDHRTINGADAAVFTRYIAKLLADPRKILL
ncbi:MAG: dihydrolipoyllysine-residue acetyltransferase [Moraxella sp.]|nr:dihydrolipoyllysine-residue acetyltransferase [Moraxella sp.]